MRVTTQWHRMPSEVVVSPPDTTLEIFKRYQDVVLCNLLQVALLEQVAGSDVLQRFFPRVAEIGKS